MPVQSISQVAKVLPGLQIAALTDLRGEVEEVAGPGDPGDAETLGAVAAMSLPHLETISGLLGGGGLQAAVLVTERSSLYLLIGEQTMVAAVGDVARNPESSLKVLGRAVGG